MAHNRGTLLRIPIQFHMHSVALNWQSVQKGEQTLIAGPWFWGQMKNVSIGDGWQLVRDFLGVDSEDAQSVLEFVNQYGKLSMPNSLSILPMPNSKVALPKPLPNESVFECFSLRHFATLQDYLRRMLITADPTLPTPWATASSDFRPYEIVFARDTYGSRAHVRVSSVFASMLATVQFKLTQGAKFRICSRKDCHLPFEVTSLHKRRFCTQYCAHITSLRQRRRLGGKKTQ